ncbi:MAG: hypothetical protein AAF360_18760, partial [Pseudomonadota bacterium]
MTDRAVAELFAPDLFSQPAPAPQALPEETAAIVLRTMACHFPALKAQGPVLGLGGLGLNSTNCLVETADGACVAKLKRDRSAAGTYRMKARLAQFLQDAGLPVPAFSRASDGGIIAEDEAGLWSVQRFVDAPFFSGCEGELAAAAALIGDFRQALAPL